MWTFILINLGFFYGVLAEDDNVCLVKAAKECRINSIFPREFPTNVEELRNECSNLYTVKECIAATLRNCNSENTAADDNDNELYSNDYDDYESRRKINSQKVKDMQRLIDVTSQICDETSELHRNFVPYLACIRTAIVKDFEEKTCRNYTDNVLELLGSRIQSKARIAGGNEDEIRDVRYELMGCLKVLMSMNCVIIQSKKSCDSIGVTQLILEIIEKGGRLYYQCPASRRIDIIELLDSLKLVSRQEIYVKELITVDLLL